MAKVADVRDGAEVSVETGLGWIAKVEEPRGRNAKVEIRAEHLAKPVNSWADTADAPLYDLVRRACAEGTRISYRVVVKRKKGQRTDVPLAEIASDFRIRDLEYVEVATGVVAPDPANPTAPSTLAAMAAQTAPQKAQDDFGGPTPGPTPPPSTTPQQGAESGRTCGLCGVAVAGGPPCRTVKGVLQHIDCPGEASDDVEPPGRLPSDPTPPEPSVSSTSNGVRIAEGRPWEFSNSDGTLNPGSYAYGAAEGIVLLAQDLLLARARGLEGPFKAPTEAQIRGLARRLIRAADRAQAELRDDGHVSRMAASHSRCRAAIRASLEVYPPPWGAPPADIDAWEAQIGDHAGILLRLTVELVDPGATS